MATQTLNDVTILLRNDTASNWATENPVLSKGEFGAEIDTKKFKIGDGITAWNSLAYWVFGDLGTAAYLNTGTASGNVPILDSNGKLNTSVLPALALGDTVTVADDTARFALTTASVQKGDVVIVTGTNKTYIVIDDTKLDVEAGYSQIITPANVVSVNSKTGVVVLDTDDISEGTTNLYWTSSRFDTAFAAKASTSLSDGSTIVKTTDTLILDCGNA